MSRRSACCGPPGTGVLDHAAVAALRQWRYSPLLLRPAGVVRADGDTVVHLDRQKIMTCESNPAELGVLRQRCDSCQQMDPGSRGGRCRSASSRSPFADYREDTAPVAVRVSALAT